MRQQYQEKKSLAPEIELTRVQKEADQSGKLVPSRLSLGLSLAPSRCQRSKSDRKLEVVCWRVVVLLDMVGWLWVVCGDVEFGENGKVAVKLLVMYILWVSQ